MSSKAGRLFRCRERLVHQRTELVNALRACLYEYGHVAPQGIAQLGRIAEIINDPCSDLPELARAKCQDMLEQISEQTARIECEDSENRGTGGASRHGAAIADHAGPWSVDCDGHRSLFAGDGSVPLRAGLRCVAWPGSASVLIRGQGAARRHGKSGKTPTSGDC